jgi:hypothetical protein
MNVVYDPYFQWLRMSGRSNSYGFGSITYQQHKNYLQEAVNLAGAAVNYAATDALLVLATPNASALVNGPAFPVSPGFGVLAGGREILNANAYSAKDDRLFRANVTGYSAESVVEGFSTLVGHVQSRFHSSMGS